MLLGTYEHNIDSKNRLFIPAKFRQALGDKLVYRLVNMEYPTLQLFSMEAFEQQVMSQSPGEAMTVEGRRKLRRYFMGVVEATCDAQGRINISPVFARKAGLVKECMVVGFGDYVEIMSAESYDKYLDLAAQDNDAEEASFAAEEAFVRGLRSDGAYVDLGNKAPVIGGAE